MVEQDKGGLDLEVLKKRHTAYLDFVSRYWGDPEYRARADRDPTAVAKAAGVDVPEGAEVKLSFNSDDRIHIVIPATMPTNRS